MVREDAAQYIDEAVAAIRDGDRSSARVALARALTCDPQSEMAWLWMSGIVDDPAEQLVILQRILEINPASRLAEQGVRLLKEQRPDLFAPPPKRGTGMLPPPNGGTGTLKRITQPLTNAVLAAHPGQTLSGTLAAAEQPATMKRITGPLTPDMLAPHPGQTLSATLAAAIAEPPVTLKRITQPLSNAVLPPHPGLLPAAAPDGPPKNGNGGTSAPPSQGGSGPAVSAPSGYTAGEPDLLAALLAATPTPPAAPPKNGNGAPAALPKNGNGAAALPKNGNGGFPAAARRLADASLAAHGAALLADVLPPAPPRPSLELTDLRLAAEPNPERLPPYPGMRARLGDIGPAPTSTGATMLLSPAPGGYPVPPALRPSAPLSAPAAPAPLQPAAQPAPAWPAPVAPQTPNTLRMPAARETVASAAPLAPAPAPIDAAPAPWLAPESSRPLIDAAAAADGFAAPGVAFLAEPIAQDAPAAAEPSTAAVFAEPPAAAAAASPEPLLPLRGVAPDQPRAVADAAVALAAPARPFADQAAPPAFSALPAASAAQPARISALPARAADQRLGGAALPAADIGPAAAPLASAPSLATASAQPPAPTIERPASRAAAFRPASRELPPTAGAAPGAPVETERAVRQLLPLPAPAAPRSDGALALAAPTTPDAPPRWVATGRPAFRLVDPIVAEPIGRETVEVAAQALAVSPSWLALHRQSSLSLPAATPAAQRLSAVAAMAAPATAAFAPAAAPPRRFDALAGLASAALPAAAPTVARMRLPAPATVPPPFAPSAPAGSGAALAPQRIEARSASAAARVLAPAAALLRAPATPSAPPIAPPAAAAAPIPTLARPVAAFLLPAAAPSAPIARPVADFERLAAPAVSAQSLAALPQPAGGDEASRAASRLSAERVLPLLSGAAAGAERVAALAERVRPAAARAEVATLAVAAELVSLAVERIAAAIAAEWPLAETVDRKAAGPAAPALEEASPAASADLLTTPAPGIAALEIEPAGIAAFEIEPAGAAALDESPVASAAASANLLNWLGELPAAPEALAGAATLPAPLVVAPRAGALALDAAVAQPETITLPQPLPQAAARGLSVWLLWGYLGLITLGELLTAAVAPGLISPLTSVQIGLALHAAVLIGLVAQGSLSNDEQERKLCLGLTLAPLIRLLSLSLPLTTVPQITWYPLVSIPLLMATWLIARQLRLPPRELGLRSGNLRAQLMLIGIGFGLGVLEYIILKPKPIMGDFSAQSVALTALVLTIFTGFTEELIFRGLLQRLATPVLKRTAGLIYVSLLFGVLHIGYQSLMDVVFVFLVGVLFAYLVDWSKSILGVTLAHGLTNVNLFLIMPLFASRLGDPTAPITWVVGIGTLVSMAGMWIVWREAQEPESDASGGLLLPNLRLVRESRRLSRGDLARQAGLSVRTLAELERGRLAGSQEQLARLAGALDSPPHALTGDAAASADREPSGQPPALPAE